MERANEAVLGPAQSEPGTGRNTVKLDTFPILGALIGLATLGRTTQVGAGIQPASAQYTRPSLASLRRGVGLAIAHCLAGQAHHPYGIPRPCYDVGRPVSLDGRIAHMRMNEMEKVWVTSEIKEAPFSGERAFAQRDSVIAGNASRSQCDAAGIIYV